jgi:hypothetical protein
MTGGITRTRGRCSACSQLVKSGEELVHLYGETFHRDCAFYRRSSAVGPRTKPPV